MPIRSFLLRPRALVLPLLAVLAGCAGAPRPDVALQQAQQSIQAASNAQASQYAPTELMRAQRLFQLAQAAVRDDNNEQAAVYADEALADGDLARTRAQLAQVQQQAQTKIATNQALREQLTQTTVAAPTGSPSTLPAVDAPSAMPAPPASMVGSGAAGSDGFQTMPESQQGGQ